MSQKEKKQRQRVRDREQVVIEPLDHNVLDSIGSPNVWTPETEDAWIKELKKIPAREIHVRFPPMRKPPTVRKRGKGSGWVDDM